MQDIRKDKSDSGSVSIEASISLTAFLFAFLMIYSCITLARAQANIQVAMNSAAREISQYSYLYGMTGLDKKLTEMQKKAGPDRQTAVNFIQQVSDVYDGIQTLVGKAQTTDLSQWANTISLAKGAIADNQDSVKSLWQSIQKIGSDPVGVLFGLGRIMASDGWDIAKSYLIAEPFSRLVVSKHLRRSETDTADAFCKSVGIVPGTYLGAESYFNGLDFSHSQLFPADKPDEIMLVVNYKIKVVKWLPIDLEFDITQMSQTRGWLHGDGGSY